MFFEYELKRHHKTVPGNLTTAEISKIIEHAIVDLKNRNIPGSIIVPIAYLVGSLATDYATEHSLLFSSLGSILFIVSLIRIFSIIALSKIMLINKNIWIPIFFWSNIFIGVIWATFAATAILQYHDSSTITLIIILLAGIGGGSMPSYCIWNLLSFAYLIIILGVPAVAEFYVGSSISFTIGVAISFFLLFNLIQAKIWNKHYWLSLINAFVIEKNTLELKTLNTQLTNEIADHKRTTDETVISTKKLQDIYNSAHDGIFIFDLEGRVLDVNKTMLKMFDVKRQDALKFDVHRSYMSKRNRDVDMKSIWKDACMGIDQEFTWLIKGNSRNTESTIQVNLRKTLWGNDFVIIATARDISQRVTAMEAIISANHAKTEFLANMSHELRTPMHGILGYARLGLKRSESLPREKIVEYFNLISESGKRLMGLLNNVLDFSKLEAGKMHYDLQKTNLSHLIHEVTTELAPIASEKELYFKIECECDVASVCCDQEKIMQVIRNLLFNAIKFSYKNNNITISCEDGHDAAGHPGTIINISNRGIPIPKGELSTIFEKFIQSSATKTGAGGTGLGLAISKRIINGHNGTIWAENGGSGLTIFRFLIPGKTNKNQGRAS
jgi:PAS domain S-box-containing protein